MRMIDEVSPKNALIGDRLLVGLIMSGPGVSWIRGLYLGSKGELALLASWTMDYYIYLNRSDRSRNTVVFVVRFLGRGSDGYFTVNVLTPSHGEPESSSRRATNEETCLANLILASLPLYPFLDPLFLTIVRTLTTRGPEFFRLALRILSSISFYSLALFWTLALKIYSQNNAFYARSVHRESSQKWENRESQKSKIQTKKSAKSIIMKKKRKRIHIIVWFMKRKASRKWPIQKSILVL